MKDDHRETRGLARITPHVDVYDQARRLGLAAPQTAAILPRNFAAAASPSDLSHESSASTVRKILAQQGTALPQLQPLSGGRLSTVVEFDVQSIAPEVVFCLEGFSVVGLIGTIVKVLLTWGRSSTKVRLRCVVQRASDQSFLHLDWSGPSSAGPDVEKIIQELHHGT